MRIQPSVLFNINIAATCRNFSYSGITVYASIIGTRDSLASGIVASADPAGIKISCRIQDVIASSGLTLAINTYVKSVGAAGCPIDYFVA